MLKQALRRWLARSWPSALATYHAAKMRRHFRAEFKTRQRRHKNRLFGAATPRVLSGPFAGMLYLDEIVWGPIEPKWLGTYERELAPALARILATPYETIVDIGSAEGYYSVGLARHFPGARVHSFDIDPWARAQQRRLARTNGVTNLQIGTRCAGPDLAALVAGRTLIVCDVEGYEYDLLDPVGTPQLATCDILVEVHGDTARDLSEAEGAEDLRRRFRSSHLANVFAAAPPDLADVDAGLRAKLSEAELSACIDERRSPDQRWLWLQAKAYAEEEHRQEIGRATA